MGNRRTIKALEELVKTENMAVAALDSAMEETEDNKLRRQYRKWRDSHLKQGDALNHRLEELGGEPVPYEVGTGKGQATLWGKLTGMQHGASVAGMRVGAERGIKRYIDHLEEIDDPKALSIIRKNLESKQDEIEWYDQQATKERAHMLETKLDVSKEKLQEVSATSNGAKRGGGIPFPLLIILGAIAAAAFFLLRRGEDSDYDDYGEDAFRYEDEEAGTSASTEYGSSSFSAGNGSTASDYSTGMTAAGDTQA
jgi:hypothetical protein